MPGGKTAKLELKLQQAGMPLGLLRVDFRLLQWIMLVLLPLTCVAYAALVKLSTQGIIILGLLGLIGGTSLPYVYLRFKTKRRNRQAFRELSDFLDLLTVSLEAGLGFDSALSKLLARKTGVLSNEFQRCLEEIRLGLSRKEALVGVKERLAVDEVHMLINSILQAEKLGIGLVKVMRVLSQEVREKRKQMAEEAAMKAPIKMLFPLVFFIFPCMFIVLLGPVVIQIVQVFINNLNSRPNYTYTGSLTEKAL